MKCSSRIDHRWALIGAFAALAVALLIAVPAGGASTTTVRVSSAEGLSGDEVTVRLEAEGLPDPGLGAFTINVTYDPNVASPVACQKDPAGILDTLLCDTAFSGDAIRVGGFRTSSGATGTVALAEITFRLVGQTDACGSLDPAVEEFADTDAQPIAPLDLAPGSLCVNGASGGSTPSGSTPAVAAHPGGPNATSGAGTALPSAATSAAAGAAAGSQAGGAASAAVLGTPGPTQMAASAPTSVAEAAGSAKSPIETEASGGGMPWIVAIAGAVAIIGAMSVAYFVYRRLRRQTS
jgi:hypothetical protein